jgi:hypothetical protein
MVTTGGTGSWAYGNVCWMRAVNSGSAHTGRRDASYASGENPEKGLTFPKPPPTCGEKAVECAMPGVNGAKAPYGEPRPGCP